MRASARELLVPFFYTFGMVRPRDSNPRPPAPKADALPTELSRSLQSYSLFFLSTNKLHVAMQVWFRRQSSEKVEFKVFKDDDLEMR